MVTINVVEIDPNTRTYKVTHTESGIKSAELTVVIGEGQSWDKEFPKIVAAIMALTGVHDPEMLNIVQPKSVMV